MDNAREYTLSVLNDLTASSQEELELFIAALNKIKDHNLKQALSNYLTEKEGYINKLESEIKRLGGDLKTAKLESPSFKEEALNNKTDRYENILNACVEKNERTLNKYSDAINGNILWEVVPLIARQYFDSKIMHNNLTYLSEKMHHSQLNIS